MGLGDAWKRFEFRAACLFTGYKHREPGLSRELDRVGLGDVARMWQFPTPLDKPLMRQVRGKMSIHQGFFNSGMGHYRALKTAYETGAKHSLVIEDDMRFLKDLGLLEEIVSELPDDFDVALFDVIKPRSTDMKEIRGNIENRKVSPHWCRWRTMRSFGCYAMSRRAMSKWIQAFEKPFRTPGMKLHTADWYLCDVWFGAGANLYHAVPNAAIQTQEGGSNSGMGQLEFYRDLGLNLEAYAPR